MLATKCLRVRRFIVPDFLNGCSLLLMRFGYFYFNFYAVTAEFGRLPRWYSMLLRFLTCVGLFVTGRVGLFGTGC